MLLPLQAFVWVSQANPPQPRTCPGHVLIWVTDGRLRHAITSGREQAICVTSRRAPPLPPFHPPGRKAMPP